MLGVAGWPALRAANVPTAAVISDRFRPGRLRSAKHLQQARFRGSDGTGGAVDRPQQRSLQAHRTRYCFGHRGNCGPLRLTGVERVLVSGEREDEDGTEGRAHRANGRWVVQR